MKSTEWLKAAFIRAIKTMAQTALSMVTIGQAMMDIDWIKVVSVSFVAGLISILTSIAGLPEVGNDFSCIPDREDNND